MACRRGALIVFEGVDRAGKTTQCQKLVQALRVSGENAEMIRFPDRTTEIGEVINAYLDKKSDLEDHTVHLLFSANRWEKVPYIRRKLEQGVTLIVDRYAFSGVAFTSAKPGFSLEWCKSSDIGLPKPDLVFFLQLNPFSAAQRGEFGAERYETSDFQTAVQQRFDHLLLDASIHWKVIDASQSIEDLHSQIRSYSEDVMELVARQPIGELWK
ncbi:thymidylate kinase isoform X1 [Polypterus senegalus]